MTTHLEHVEPAVSPTDMRTAFAQTAERLLDEDPLTAVVLADISADLFTEAARRHPGRTLNVGIREPLMVSVAGGLSLSGLRPIAHSYAPFLVERSFEQIKLDLGHQDARAVLVSVGASYDWTQGGRTHQSPGDVALLDTLPGFAVHVPGHPDEVPALLRRAVAGDGSAYIRLSNRSNAAARPAAVTGAGMIDVVRRGGGALVLAVGPMLDSVLAATAGLDVTVGYAATVRPLDLVAVRELSGPGTPGNAADVVLVEPYLAGTSARLVDEALADRPHRTLALGVGRTEVRRYGTPEEHDVVHELDPAGLRRSVDGFLGRGAS
ncbi:transketolase family protein [Actinopolymorpha singaporensis]|uniref:Transketolase n=1 Tax=Actinopolymorpha singaporensis TaxID=117157 RepID=A0A1H1M9P4_9ACTN|nr:transketolase [Actinopolymorpha singaporensis]SDR83523.1 transketolase [Actinopolymorpha singaporensis]